MVMDVQAIVKLNLGGIVMVAHLPHLTLVMRYVAMEEGF